ncbi:MAG: type II secretion system F family protein, partial [Pirellulales bacterium]
FVDVYDEFQMDLPVITLFVMSIARSGFPWFSMAGVLFLLLLSGLRIGAPSWFPSRWLNRLPLIGPLWSWVSYAEFARLLAILVRHGVPLPESLRVTADGVHDRWLATGCRTIAADVESGQPLAAAIASERLFPASLTSLIDWGQTTGGLASSLEMAGDIYTDRVELQAAFVKAVLPPILLLVILIMVSLLIVSLMLPMVDLIQGLT